MRKLLLICILSMLLGMVDAKDLTKCNIISDITCKFTATTGGNSYWDVMKAFVSGIDWSRYYGSYTDNCLLTSFPALLDEFNNMAVNNTDSANDWEGRMMFLSKLWSGAYADTMFNCYRWVGIVQ